MYQQGQIIYDLDKRELTFADYNNIPAFPQHHTCLTDKRTLDIFTGDTPKYTYTILEAQKLLEQGILVPYTEMPSYLRKKVETKYIWDKAKSNLEDCYMHGRNFLILLWDIALIWAGKDIWWNDQ